MNNLKYFLQFFLIISLFFLYKLLGLKYSSILSGTILYILGPLFRSNQISHKNITRAFPNLNKNERQKILKNMWLNYGKILAEYVFLKEKRKCYEYSKKIIVENQQELEKIKTNKRPVIFISGHFNNFELMAMHIEKSGIDLAAIYRPLNNKFLNPVMENIRKKYICKNQIKKGISGTKELLKHFKKGISIALMVDQRVSQGIKSNLFNEKALTTNYSSSVCQKI